MRVTMVGQRASVQPCFVACGAQRSIARSLRWQPRRCDAGEKSWTRETTCHSVQELNSIGSCMLCWGVEVHGGCALRLSLLSFGLVVRNQPGQARLLNVAFQQHKALKYSVHKQHAQFVARHSLIFDSASCRIRGEFAECRSPKLMQAFTAPCIAIQNQRSCTLRNYHNRAVAGLSFTQFVRARVHLSGCYER